MNNLFISATKNFYNYISSTHCKDFKQQWKDFYKNKCDLEKSYRMGFGFTIKKLEKKTYNSLHDLYFYLFHENNDFLDIKRYIFKKYSEEDEFENWVKVLSSFADYVYKYTDPMFICPAKDICKVKKTQNTTNLTIDYEDKFIFSIEFEKSKIKKGNSTLFDTITGLDKENTLSFIKIKITNKMSNTEYIYDYMEDSSLINKNELDDDICDMQLELVKDALDRFIYNYIGIVFDTIVNRELTDKYEDFRLFNSTFIRENYKELEEEWLEITD